MYNIIAPAIIILCLVVVFVIFLRKIKHIGKNKEESAVISTDVDKPEIEKQEEKIKESIPGENDFFDKGDDVLSRDKEGFITTWIKRIKEKIDFKKFKFALVQFLEKVLRKSKVSLMKIENIAGELTKKLSAKAKKLNSGLKKPEDDEKKDAETEYNTDEELNDNSDKSVEDKTETVIFKKQKGKEEDTKDKEVGDVGAKRESDIETEKELIYKIAKNPTNAENYIELGDLYSEADNYDDAIQAFEQALKLDKNNKEAKKGIRKIKGKNKNRAS